MIQTHFRAFVRDSRKRVEAILAHEVIKFEKEINGIKKTLHKSMYGLSQGSKTKQIEKITKKISSSRYADYSIISELQKLNDMQNFDQEKFKQAKDNLAGFGQSYLQKKAFALVNLRDTLKNSFSEEVFEFQQLSETFLCNEERLNIFSALEDKLQQNENYLGDIEDARYDQFQSHCNHLNEYNRQYTQNLIGDTLCSSSQRSNSNHRSNYSQKMSVSQSPCNSMASMTSGYQGQGEMMSRMHMVQEQQKNYHQNRQSNQYKQQKGETIGQSQIIRHKQTKISSLGTSPRKIKKKIRPINKANRIADAANASKTPNNYMRGGLQIKNEKIKVNENILKENKQTANVDKSLSNDLSITQKENDNAKTTTKACKDIKNTKDIEDCVKNSSHNEDKIQSQVLEFTVLDTNFQSNKENDNNDETPLLIKLSNYDINSPKNILNLKFSSKIQKSQSLKNVMMMINANTTQGIDKGIEGEQLNLYIVSKDTQGQETSLFSGKITQNIDNLLPFISGNNLDKLSNVSLKFTSLTQETIPSLIKIKKLHFVNQDINKQTTNSF